VPRDHVDAATVSERMPVNALDSTF